MQKYEIGRELGTGSYGKVVLAKNKRNGEQVAMKQIQMANLPQVAREKTLQEVQLLRSLDHPNIVRLKDSFQDKNVLYIIMEYVDGGDLAQKIKNRGTKPFAEEEILHIFMQLTVALDYIHEKKIVHRDIKPQNVFLTSVGVVKLGDFGVARALEDTQDLCQTVIGTPYYLSPEVWNNAPYNSMTDIWSLGCILYEMCALKRPFTGRDAAQLLAMVIRGQYEPIPKRYSKEVKSIVDSMLNTNAAQRPSAGQILQVPFIRTRILGAIKANEAQLNTVNVIAPDAKGGKQSASKMGLKAAHRAQAGKSIEPATKGLPNLHVKDDRTCNLPLPPEEEAPRWAQRSNISRMTEVTVPVRQHDTNDYEDLQEATAKLHMSLSIPKGTLPPWAKGEDIPLDEGSLKLKLASVRETLEQKLGDQLFEMLYENIANEDDPNCAQFVDIMNESDPDIVEQMRELISLENIS